MRIADPVLVAILGLTLCVGLDLAAFASGAPGAGAGPVLVVAPPWDGGAEQVVETAGGRVVGPGSAPFSVLATGATPAAYELAGAWLVLDPAVLEILCGNKDTR